MSWTIAGKQVVSATEKTEHQQRTFQEQFVKSQDDHRQPATSQDPPQLQKYQCNICGKLLACEAWYTEHMKSHPSKRPFKCLKCNYSSNRRHNLQTHMKVHEDGKVHRQPRKFLHARELAKSLQGVKCTKCDYRSNRKHNLKTHMKIHEDGKQHRPPRRPWKLAKSEEDDLQPAQSQDQLQKYLCNVCGEQQTCKAWFAEHMKTHSDQWPFKCPKCDYRSNRKNNVKIHMKVHEEGEHVKCTMCDYQTKFSSNLKSHMRRKHNINS